MDIKAMALAAQQLGKILNSLVEEQDSGDITEFALKRYERDSKKLMSQSPALAHHVLGIIRTVEEQFEEAYQHFETSLQLEASVTTYLNYALTLKRGGEILKAIAMVKEAELLEPTNLTVKNELLGYLSEGVLTPEYCRVYDQYNALGHLEQMSGEHDCAVPRMANDILAEQSISENDLNLAVQTVWTALPMNRVKRIEMWFHEASICVEYLFNATVDELVDFNMSIVEALAEVDFETQVLSTISFAASPAKR